ncbi:MAG TPA: helix-turn-helix domain-containing protein [Trebonia sp.]|nr:helix-turn-helix domain-containing protein [Trebonia sp.]
MGQEAEKRTTTRRTQAERRAEAEQGLLDAALRLFAKKGVENTTLAEIGDAAGYSRGLANHHFGSKAALVERLAERSRVRFRSAFRDQFRSRAENEIEALVRGADLFLAAGGKTTDEVRGFFVLWGSALPEETEYRDGFIDHDRRVRAFVQRLVAFGQRRGTIRADVDPAGFAAAYMSLLRGGVPLMLMDQTIGVEAVRRTVADMVHRQLSPEEAR